MNAFPRRSLVVALAWLAVTVTAQAKDNKTVRLLNMYAKSEADLFEVHIIADGDISGFKTTRRMGTDSYRLTLDVPAVPPVDSKYDVTTPFTRRFEMWPMKLGDRVYTRVMMEIDLKASSVVSQIRPSRILIKISRNSPTALADASHGDDYNEAGIGHDSEASAEPPGVADAPTEPASAPTVKRGSVPAVGPGVDASPPVPPALPPSPGESLPSDSSEEAETGESQPPSTSEAQETAGQSGEFISLFPAPDESRPIFDTPLEQIDGVGGGPTDGWLLGRFLFRPFVEGSWIRGDNLTLQTDESFEDTAIYARAVAAFDLLDSDNSLHFNYELRYRKFNKFQLLRENFSHGVNVGTGVTLSSTMKFKAENHFFRGSFETIEFDPGQEVFFNVEPFNRNRTIVGLEKDMSERLSVAVTGTYDFVRFQGEKIAFFSYDTMAVRANFRYRLSPVKSVFGEYVRANTPEPTGRPEAKRTGNAFLAGIQGELTPLLLGTIRVGYSAQDFGTDEANALDFRGLVASVSLTRYFTEAAALTIEGGRQTNLSNFENNNYCKSDFLNLQFTGPMRRNLQLIAGAYLVDNLYPLEASELPERRNDTVLAGWVGAAYFFSQQTYFRADYRHERRRSNLDEFQYTNNVIRLVFGIGFFSE